MVIYKTSQGWSLLLQCLQKLAHLFNTEIILWNEDFNLFCVLLVIVIMIDSSKKNKRWVLNFRVCIFLESAVLRGLSTHEPHPNACPLFEFIIPGTYFQNGEVHTHDKIKVLLRYLKTTHYFSNKHHIFSSDKENSPGNVAVLVSNMDSFYGILKQKVGWNIPETIEFNQHLHCFKYDVC